MTILERISDLKPVQLIYQELMEAIKVSLQSIAVDREQHPNIRKNQDFWKEQLEGTSEEVTKEALINMSEKAFEEIRNSYLNGDEHKEYLKHIRKKGSKKEEMELPEEERLSENEGSLFDDVMTKINAVDAEVPALMYEIISFFDQVSKQTPEKQKDLLAQFPPKNQDDYNCVGGSQTRLINVKMQMGDSLGQSFNALLDKSCPPILKFINPGNQVHLTALLHKSLGITPNDILWHSAATQIPAKEVWHFIRSFNKELYTIHQEKITEDKNDLEKISALFDKIRTDETVIMGGFPKIQEATRSCWRFLDVSNGTEFMRNFFELDDFSNPVTLKMVGETTVMENKLQDVAEKLKSVTEPKNEEVFNFELHDNDAPEKIAALLRGQNSTESQKHVALSALWVLSENFAGNSAFNALKTATLLSGEVGKEITNEMINSEHYSKTLSEINHNLGRIRTKIAPQAQEQNEEYVNEVNHNIDLGMSAEFLDQCIENKKLGQVFIAELIKRNTQDHEHDHLEWVKLFFYHPKREKILEAFQVCAKGDIYFEAENFFILISTEKQDKDLLKDLLEDLDEENIKNYALYILGCAVHHQNYEMAEIVFSCLENLESNLNLLELSIEKEYFDVAKYLIHIRKYDINGKGNSDLNHLSVAIVKENAEIVQMLLAHGADITAANNIGGTAISTAAFLRDFDMLKILIEHSFNKLPLLILEESYLEKIKNVFDKSLNFSADYEIKNSINESIEIFSALQDRSNPEAKAKIIEFAIKNDYENLAESLMQESSQEACFLKAAEYGSLDIVKLLIKKGVDVDFTNENRETAFLVAMANGKFTTGLYLINEAEANANAINKDNKNVFHIILDNKYDESEMILESLVKKDKCKESLHVQDKAGNTPLHIVITNHCVHKEHFVTDNNFNLKNNAQETPFMIAVENNIFKLASTIFNKLNSVSQINVLSQIISGKNHHLQNKLLNFIESTHFPDPSPSAESAEPLTMSQAATNNPPAQEKKGKPASRIQPINYEAINIKVKALYGNTPSVETFNRGIIKLKDKGVLVASSRSARNLF
ncbi:MAG: ankyrin repeat protein [Lentimonas sp.]|jgi:ankyrin repeat protein